MSRYIDAELLEPDTEWDEYEDGFISYSQLNIDAQPTADVRENVGAVWIERELKSLLGRTRTETRCGNCGFEVYRKTPFCPNCGADMRGEA